MPKMPTDARVLVGWVASKLGVIIAQQKNFLYVYCGDCENQLFWKWDDGITTRYGVWSCSQCKARYDNKQGSSSSSVIELNEFGEALVRGRDLYQWVGGWLDLESGNYTVEVKM